MKTTHDVEGLLYAVLYGSQIMQVISGGIYRKERPSNSSLEDIVINALPITGTQVQRATANVNLHIPDKEFRIGGQTTKRPDTARSKELTDLAVSVLEAYSQQQSYFVDRQQEIQDPATGRYYVNIRIEFRFFPSQTV